MSASAQRIILLVGPPGTGKSTLAKAIVRVFPNYVRINQDDLGDRAACEELTMSALQAKNRTQSVIIDRCNFDADQRKVWVGIGKQLGVEDICVVILDTEFYHCKTRILARTNHPTQVEGAAGVDILYKFMDMTTLPTYFEGFSRIMRVEPQPTEEYSDEAVHEVLAKLEEVQKPKNLEVPRWQKEEFYFKNQYHRDQERYRARKAAAAAAAQKGAHKGMQLDSEGFAIKKKHGQKEEPSAPAPVRPPLFGAAGGGWRAREAAKQQEPKRFGPTLHEVPKPAVANPFDLLGEGEDE